MFRFEDIPWIFSNHRDYFWKDLWIEFTPVTYCIEIWNEMEKLQVFWCIDDKFIKEYICENIGYKENIKDTVSLWSISKFPLDTYPEIFNENPLLFETTVNPKDWHQYFGYN